VDHVVGEEQGDVEPRLLHRDPLHAARGRRTPEVEEGADPAVADLAVTAAGCLGPRLAPLGGGHDELADLLLQRHQGEERIGEAGVAGGSRGRLNAAGWWGRATEGGREGQADEGGSNGRRHDVLSMGNVKKGWSQVSGVILSGAKEP